MSRFSGLAGLVALGEQVTLHGPEGSLVAAAAVAGATVTIWTSRDGQPTDPPLQNSQVAGQTDLAETFGVIALASTLIVIDMLVRWALDRRRMAAWDQDWLATGPRWTPRR